MTRMINLLAWGLLVIVAGLVALNWSTLMIAAPLNLVVAQIEAPLGIVLLGLFAILASLFFVAYLRNQISSLMEARRLLKEMHHAHDLADKAEVSRVETLHQFIATEFRLLNERLNTGTVTTTAPPVEVEEEGRPWSLTELVTGHERPH